MTDTQQTALKGIPKGDMLVDPAKLAAILEEPRDSDIVSMRVLAISLALSLALVILCALWWATQ